MFEFKRLRPLTSGLPKIVVLSGFLVGPSLRVCEGLIRAGADLKILSFDKTKRIYAESYSGFGDNIEEVRVGNKPVFHKYLALSKIILNKYPYKVNGVEAPFLDVNMHIDLHINSNFADAGIILSCRPCGMIDWTKAKKFFKNKLVVSRMTDMSTITGFCAHSAGCEKWKYEGCKKCPQLNDSVDCSDFPAQNFSRKLLGYADIDMAFVTPSNWLGEYVKASTLVKDKPQITIPTSVNLDNYKPYKKKQARLRLGLPLSHKIILFCTGAFRMNKGFNVLCESLRMLVGQWANSPPIVLLVGKNYPMENFPSEYQYINIGYVDDIARLSTIYSASNLLVSASFQDNLPNTVNEALSCGTPVICFDKYSSEDVIRDGVTGYLAEHPGLPFSSSGELIQDPLYTVSSDKLIDLAAKIKKLIEMSSDEYETLCIKCRKEALQYFSPVLQAKRYLTLFRKLLGLKELNIEEIEGENI